MKDSKIIQIFWKSLTEGGFLAGICLIGFRAIGFDDLSTFQAYLFTLVALTLTAFNIRLYSKSKEARPDIEYVGGHDQTMEWLIEHVKGARDSIWVTRFSKGRVSQDSEYFRVTKKRIKGEKCTQIYSYRRIMKLDTLDKIDFATSLIKDHAKNENFFFRETEMFLPFEVIVIDKKAAFVMFHDTDQTRTVNSGIKLTNWEVVSRFVEIYEGLWTHDKTHRLKESSLSEDELTGVLARLDLGRSKIKSEEIERQAPNNA